MQTGTLGQRSETGEFTLKSVLLGALVTNKTISGCEVMDRAMVLGLSSPAAARAIHDLHDEGLADVTLEGGAVFVSATPSLDLVNRAVRVHCVLANLAVTKSLVPALGKNYA